MASRKSVKKSDAVWSKFLLFVKVFGTLNMAIDTFVIVMIGVDPAFWNVARALLVVLVIDITMLAFWGMLDYTSNSRGNRMQKLGAAVIIWMMFVGQVVIGANLHGSAGVVARMATGGALAISTYKYATDMWKSIKDGRKDDRRTLPEKMQALRVGIWQTSYSVAAVVVASPIILMVAVIKLLIDMTRDFGKITAAYIPVVDPPKAPISNKSTRIVRTRGKVKSSNTPEPTLGSDGLWRVKCPVCPEHIAKGQPTQANAKRSYGGHMSKREHARNEQNAKSGKKSQNGDTAHRREELSLSG